MLGLLLGQRARLAWNRVARGRRRGWRVLGAGLVVAFTGGFVIFAGLNAGGLTERVALQDPQAAAQALPVLLVGVTALTLVTSLSSAFHHLFLAGDLELLLASPVPARSLFGLKVIEIWRDSLHVLLFQAAALYAYGRALRMPPPYYPEALLVGMMLTTAASAAGAMLTLAMARVRFGQSILGFSRLLAILLFLPVGVLGVPAFGLGRGRFSLLLNQSEVNAISGQLQSIGPPPVWAPTTWAAHLLLGDEAAGLSLILLLMTAATFFVGAQLAYDALFQSSWERVRYSAPQRKTKPKKGHAPGIARASSSPVLAIVQKDWRTLLRDPRWRTGALISVVALGLPAVVLFAGDPLARANHLTRFWFGMLPVPYLAYLIGSQQAAATLAYEGRNIALLRSAPIGMSRIFLSKLLGGVGLVLLVTLGATMALGLKHNGEPLEMLAALLAACWLALGAALSAVAVGALTADFEGDNPQRRVGCLGTIVTSMLSIVFFGSNTGLFVWWVIRAVAAVPRPLQAFVPIVDWTLPVVALASVGAVLLASRLGMRRVASWEAS